MKTLWPVLLLLPCLIVLPLQAQDSAGGDSELAALKAENAILEQRIKLEENQRKLLEAKVPSAEVEPLEGDTTVDGLPIESQVMAYRALSKLAQEIAKKIEKTAGAGPIIIFDPVELDAIIRYQAFLRQLKILNTELRRLVPDGPEAAGLGVIPVIGGLLRSVADVASLFRTDTTLKTTAMEIEPIALISEVARHLGEIVVYHPALYPPSLLELGDAGSSKLLEQLDELDGLRDKAARKVVERKKRKADLEKLIAKPGQLKADKEKLEKELETATGSRRTEIKKKIAEIDAKLPAATSEAETAKNELSGVQDLITALEKTIELYGALKVGLLKAEGDAGITVLSRLLRAEGLQQVMNAATTHTVVLEVLEAAGSTRTRKNLFTGSRLDHSGGAIVSYLLFARDGRLAASGTVGRRLGPVKYKHAGDLRVVQD